MKLACLATAMLWLHVRVGAAEPSPVSVPVTQNWNGDDGYWSSFEVQIGTPPQAVSVLPFTSENAVSAIVPDGCTSEDPSSCPDSRGFLFDPSDSSSWSAIGRYKLYQETQLGYYGNADFGYDNVSFGWPGSTKIPTLDHQVVMGVATKTFYIGSLGLNPAAINWTSVEDYHPSLLTSLRSSQLIPSTSWGYTAGAYYRDPPVFGSLTIGGYDSTRFVAKGLSIPFGSNSPWQLQVPIQSITTDKSKASTSLLSSGIYALIDSSTPHIWLPVDACEAFESAFGLTYNSTANMYFVSDALHEQLLTQNPSVTFQIGADLTNTKNAIDIVMPYASFDLVANPPFVSAPRRYFPLRRAASQEQNTLGRAFLQEAYIIADFDRQNFSVSPARFPSSTATIPNLIAIYAPGASPTLTSAASGGPSATPLLVIIAAAVASVVAVLIIGGVAFALWRRRHRRRRAAVLETDSASSAAGSTAAGFEKPELDSKPSPVVEIHTPPRKPELAAAEPSQRLTELYADGSGGAELASPTFPVEMKEAEEERHAGADEEDVVRWELPGEDRQIAELEAAPVRKAPKAMDELRS